MEDTHKSPQMIAHLSRLITSAIDVTRTPQQILLTSGPITGGPPQSGVVFLVLSARKKATHLKTKRTLTNTINNSTTHAGFPANNHVKVRRQPVDTLSALVVT